MNSPRTVIGFVNAAHFIDHYAMLVFAAAVVVMAPVFDLDFSRLLALATPGFVAFGAGSLFTGWLGDRWSRRHMLAIFFTGIGVAMMATGLVSRPWQLAMGLFVIGAFASIYHPVGTAMLVSHADRLGRQIGINGVWGNLGVASSALVTGLICQVLGWRWAFLLPGAVSVAIGLVFLRRVVDEPRRVVIAAAAARLPAGTMRRVVLALVVTIIASSTTFNAITVALPKLFAERLSGLQDSPLRIGLIASGVYVCGAVAQYAIGHWLDRVSLKVVFLPVALVIAPLLAAAAYLQGAALVIASMGLVAALFALVTINDAMVARYTSDEWRGRAYSARYFIGFTAAGAATVLVAALYAQGGFTLMLRTFAFLCVLIVVGAMIFPGRIRRQVRA